MPNLQQSVRQVANDMMSHGSHSHGHGHGGPYGPLSPPIFDSSTPTSPVLTDRRAQRGSFDFERKSGLERITE